MNNADMPATPSSNSSGKAVGLTKREKFCLHMGVAETGDPELDGIIKKGNKQKAAMYAMQGFCRNLFETTEYPKMSAMQAERYADELIEELYK